MKKAIKKAYCSNEESALKITVDNSYFIHLCAKFFAVMSAKPSCLKCYEISWTSRALLIRTLFQSGSEKRAGKIRVRGSG
jgi:hypothetical protein